MQALAHGGSIQSQFAARPGGSTPAHAHGHGSHEQSPRPASELIESQLPNFPGFLGDVDLHAG